MIKRKILLVAGVMCIGVSMLVVAGCGSGSNNTPETSVAQNTTEAASSSQQPTTQQETTAPPTTTKTPVVLSYDLSADVRAGLLYSSEDGKITDKNGDVVPEYSDITILDNGSLSDAGAVLEGYFVGSGGKIVYKAPETKPVETKPVPTSEHPTETEDMDEYYLCPWSDRAYMDYSDFDDIDPDLVHSDVMQLLINEIYARHGYIFSNSEYQEYFESMPWYTPKYTASEFDTSVFNKYEKANIDFLSNFVDGLKEEGL